LTGQIRFIHASAPSLVLRLNSATAYDAGRQTSMVDSTGTTTWTHNNANEVTQLATPQGTMSYTYYSDGRRNTMVDSAGTTTYGYDNAGRMTSLQNQSSETTSFTYDNANRTTRQTFSTGQYDALGYDDRDRQTSAYCNNNPVIATDANGLHMQNVMVVGELAASIEAAGGTGLALGGGGTGLAVGGGTIVGTGVAEALPGAGVIIIQGGTTTSIGTRIFAILLVGVLLAGSLPGAGPTGGGPEGDDFEVDDEGMIDVYRLGHSGGNYWAPTDPRQDPDYFDHYWISHDRNDGNMVSTGRVPASGKGITWIPRPAQDYGGNSLGNGLTEIYIPDAGIVVGPQTFPRDGGVFDEQADVWIRGSRHGGRNR
jgi:YD repeat-containing protein